MSLHVGPEGLPWPQGDPAGLRASAGHASLMQQQLQSQASGFAAILGPLDWTGQARSSFSATATQQSAAVRSAANAFGQAAQALTGLAGVLEQAQQQVLDAARKLHAARQAEAGAVRYAVSARTAADDARRQADAAASTPMAPHYAASAQDAETTASTLEATAAQAVDHTQSVERWAMRLAHDAVDRARAADGRVANELDALDLVGGVGPGTPVGTDASGLSLLVTPLLGSPGALQALGKLVFGSAVNDRSSLLSWLTAPPPLPPPPPPPRPKPKHHSGSFWGAFGVTLLAAGADVFAGAQLGLDPLADGAAGAADGAAVEMDTAAASDEAAVADAGTADVGASATSAATVRVLTAEAADGSTVPLTEEEQAAAQAWAKDLPTRPTPVNDARGVYEVNQTGESNLLMKGGDQRIWADGFRTEDGNALEAKYISKPGRSPFVDGSNAPEFVRQKAISDITSEVSRYGAVVRDPTTPVRALEVVTNDPNAAQVFARLMDEMGVPGRVVVRP